MHHLEKRVAALEALHRVRAPVRVFAEELEEVVVACIFPRIRLPFRVSRADFGLLVDHLEGPELFLDVNFRCTVM